ncbi:Glutaredoxin [Halopseudomonas litoralis]|uniref:Glutaredoxin n=1 Tax=Halopseudomonas litoralis TaxID=797277 RepID=A0A1H1UZR4_9GAMM|nr:glutaredoxin [Halopseudomonas litoralis]SDS78012.1 Glutaredoxin [Halopseudomonas litoralis]
MNDTPNYVYQKEGCPFAAKATELLDRQRVPYRLHVFADATEEQLFKDEHDVDTTPQVFIDGQRIGGYTELAAHFGEQPESD